MKKKNIILTIIYSLFAIPVICLIFYSLILNLMDGLLYSFDIIIFLGMFIIELLVVIMPYILLIINKRKKSKSLTNEIFIYELVMIILGAGFAFFLWFMWPTIKKSITSCWCVVQNSDGTTTTGCCD